jgi:hypothetical protein
MKKKATTNQELKSPAQLAARAYKRKFEQTNKLKALRTVFKSADPLWHQFLQCFDRSKKRMLWYPCSGAAYADVLPLAESENPPDLCVFVDYAWGAGGDFRVDNGLFRGALTGICNIVELEVDPDFFRVQMQASISLCRKPTAKYFQMTYRTEGNGIEKKIDCLFFQSDWWAVLSGFILKHRVPVNDLILDWDRDVSLLATRAKQLGLGRVLSKLGPLPDAVKLAREVTDTTFRDEHWTPKVSNFLRKQHDPNTPFQPNAFRKRCDFPGAPQGYPNRELWEKVYYPKGEYPDMTESEQQVEMKHFGNPIEGIFLPT